MGAWNVIKDESHVSVHRIFYAMHTCVMLSPLLRRPVDCDTGAALPQQPGYIDRQNLYKDMVGVGENNSTAALNKE